MKKGKDLTGSAFGYLTVLHEAEAPYTTPGSNKKIRRWVCRCERCGKEITLLQNTLKRAKSCGCLRSDTLKSKTSRNTKRCVVCGKEFEAPPSSKKVTCSKECSAIHKERTHTGLHWKVSEEGRSNMKKSGEALERARSAALLASAAASKLPEGQKGPQNRTCKVYLLKDPDNVTHLVVGLLPWARENYMLFEPHSTNPEASARRIASGFRAIISNSVSRRDHPVSSYKGWQVLYYGDKSPDDQMKAMEEYCLRNTGED